MEMVEEPVETTSTLIEQTYRQSCNCVTRSGSGAVLSSHIKPMGFVADKIGTLIVFPVVLVDARLLQSVKKQAQQETKVDHGRL